MRKIVAVGMTAALALTLVGCSGGGGSSDGGADGADAKTEAPAPKENKLTLVESGYTITDSGYVMYGVVLKNEGDQTIRFPTIKVTGRDDAGNVVSSDEQKLNVIAPGETSTWGGQAGNGTTPATVEFEVSTDEDDWYDPTEAMPTFEVSGASAQDSGYGIVHFVGEVTNTSDVDASSVCLTVILRDESGAIVGGYSGYVSDLAAGATTSFDITGYSVPAYATLEATGKNWGVEGLF